MGETVSALSLRCPITRDLSLLRRQVRDYAAVAGVPWERAEDLMMAVSEAASNVGEHAGSRGTVVVWAGVLGVWVDVIDERGALSAAHRAGAAEPDAERGRGLAIVAELCDWAGVKQSDRGSRLRMLVRYQPDGERSGSAVGACDGAVAR